MWVLEKKQGKHVGLELGVRGTGRRLGPGDSSRDQTSSPNVGGHGSNL